MMGPEYHADWREKNRESVRNSVNKFRKVRRERIAQIKTEAGCADCGYNAHPSALHFDHLPGQEKLFHIAGNLTGKWEHIEAEMAKCEVVCANCHAIRTAARRGY